MLLALRWRLRLQPARFAGAVQEAANDAEHFRLLEQEGVVALVGDDFGKRHPRARGVERMHDGAGFRGWEQPVAGERNHTEPGLRALESIGQHATGIRRHIEVIHGPRQIEIRIGVKAVDERRALVAQIGFHLEIRVE